MAAVYCATAWIGHVLVIELGSTRIVWPPAGIALGAALLFGYRVWPGVLLGSFLSTVVSQNTIGLDGGGLAAERLVALGIAVGASVQVIVGVFVVRRYGAFPSRLTGMRDVLALLLLGGPLCCLTSATIGPAIMLAGGAVEPGSWIETAARLWVGDVLGVVIFMPMVLAWGLGPADLWRQRRVPVTLTLLGAFALVPLSYSYSHSNNREKELRDFKERADTIATVLELTVRDHLKPLAFLESAFREIENVSPEAYRRLTRETLIEFPALQAISWNVRFSEDNRDRRRSLQGYHTAVFRLGDMVDVALSGAVPDSVHLCILDRTAREGEQLLYASSPHDVADTSISDAHSATERSIHRVLDLPSRGCGTAMGAASWSSRGAVLCRSRERPLGSCSRWTDGFHLARHARAHRHGAQTRARAQREPPHEATRERNRLPS